MVVRSMNSDTSLPGSETCLPFNSFETLGKLAVVCVSVSSSAGTMIVLTSEGVVLNELLFVKHFIFKCIIFIWVCVLHHSVVSDSL